MEVVSASCTAVQYLPIPSLPLLLLQFSLGNKPWQPCYVVRLEGITVMLDAALDLSVLLNFLPLPLVYRYARPAVPTSHASLCLFPHSPKLSSLPCWKPRNPADEEAVMEDELLQLVKKSEWAMSGVFFH